MSDLKYRDGPILKLTLAIILSKDEQSIIKKQHTEMKKKIKSIEERFAVGHTGVLAYARDPVFYSVKQEAHKLSLVSGFFCTKSYTNKFVTI